MSRLRSILAGLRTLILPWGAGAGDPRIVLNSATGGIEIYTTGGALAGFIDGTGLYAMSGQLGDPNAYARLYVSGTDALLEMRPQDTAENDAFLPAKVYATWNDETDESPSLYLIAPQHEDLSVGPPVIQLQGEGNTTTKTKIRLSAQTYEAEGQVAGTWTRGANLSIPNNAATDVTLTADEDDPHGMLTPTSAVATIPTGHDGRYDISAWILWAAGTTGWRRLAISKNNGTTNGTDSWHVLVPTPGGTADCGQNITITLPLVGGDTIRMKAWHTQGAALNVERARLSVQKRFGMS